MARRRHPRTPSHEIKVCAADGDIQRVRWERAAKLSSAARQVVGWSIGRGYEADMRDADCFYDTARYPLYWETLT